MPTAPSLLFGDMRIATAASGESPFGHSFGGPHDRRGASRDDCGGLLIHLLHRFDLTDPAVPIVVPGLHWLPLYYCFDLRANTLGYRLVGDDAMEAFFPDDDPNVSAKESWPDDDYPEQFPRSEIRIAPHPYDPTDLEDAYAWAGVFGIARLSPEGRAELERRAVEEADALGFYPPESLAEFHEAMSNPFMQGRPDGHCLNPACVDFKAPGRLKTIALLPGEPVAGVRTFGRWGADVQLIFQSCDRCHSIRVDNQAG